MTDHFQDLIDGYLDGTLTAAEEAALTNWLQASETNADRFAANVLLHDRLRTLQAVRHPPRPAERPSSHRGKFLPWPAAITAAAASVALTALVAFCFFAGIESRPASAAVIRLEQLISVQNSMPGCTYRITVESQGPPQRQTRQPSAETSRPPKPPLNDAIVHTSGASFVLIRKTLAGLPFITGGDGQTSWAISPDGPVRFSHDLERFDHDLPGHEYDMPLASLAAGLGRLRTAYDLELEETASPHLTRLVATKRRGFRGPRRVEVISADSSGQIESLRFFDMPYGSSRLNLRMDLVATRSFEPGFFSHPAHHEPDREVVEE